MIKMKEFVVPIEDEDVINSLNKINKLKSEFVWNKGLTEKNVVTFQTTMVNGNCRMKLYYKENESGK